MGRSKQHKGKSGGNPKPNKKEEREAKKMLRRKRDRIKYGGDKWCADFKKLSEQLVGLGLQIKDVAGDGNCLFRAIGDQLDNNPAKHMEYRQNIMNFMEKNREMFEPFLDADDDGPFDDYVAGMRANGAWGGNLEIQAASLALKINIIIYQLDQPRWEVVNFADPKTKTIQLSYLDGDHYASVRPLDANATVPHATTIPAHITSTPPNTQEKWQDTEPPNDFEKLIMENSGVSDLLTVRKALEDNEYDGDAAIAYLLAIADTRVDNVEYNPIENGADVPYEHEHEHESHLHKAVRNLWPTISHILMFVYLLVFSTFSKITKHIHRPHSTPAPTGKETRKMRKQKMKEQKHVQNNTPTPVSPVNIQHAIKEMGALSI